MIARHRRLPHSVRKAHRRARPLRKGEVRGNRYRCTECGTTFTLTCGCGDLSCAYNDCPECC